MTNGRKKLILEPLETPEAKYGIGAYGTYQRIDSISDRYTQEQNDQIKRANLFLEDQINPSYWMDLTAYPIINDFQAKEDGLLRYSNETLEKFLTGQIPLSGWDNFQNNLKSMGIDQLLEVYSTSYQNQ